MSSPNSAQLKGRQLQAIKDFTAADICFRDGANPLSFQIGEHFTFISYRDKYWANVERTLIKNNSILLIEVYPPTERGIIPTDYVIEMDKGSVEDTSAEADQNGSDHDSLSGSKDNESLKAIFEKEDLERQLEVTKKNLSEAQKEIRVLNDRSKKEFEKNVQLLHQLLQQYYAASEVLVATKEELAIAQKSIINHQEISKKHQDVFEEVKTQIHKSGNKSAIKVLDKIIAKETKQPNGFVLQGKNRSLSSGEDDLMLSCTLCSEKIRVSELASHSKICSAQDKGCTKQKLTKQPSTPSPSTEMLRVNVTYSETDQKNATFKVVTKTTLPNYEFPLYEVHRSEAHFEWLQEALENSLPERIVPTLIKHTSLNGKTREFQRFLSRICAHKVLRKDGWLHLFLTGFNEELEAAKTQLDRRKSNSDSADVITDKQAYDENAPVVKCKKYMELLYRHLHELINHLQIKVDDKPTGLGVWFNLLSEGEPLDTYLKSACAALGKICQELENSNETEENLVVSDLTSIAEYVRSAKNLLSRVEQAVDTFLHWDAQVRICEVMTEPESKSAEESITQRWAVANSNCAEAKGHLERLCQDLTYELSHFDLRKESELREVLIEYSTLKSEHFEKIQSKWFGVKFMVEAPISSDVRAIKCIEELSST